MNASDFSSFVRYEYVCFSDDKRTECSVAHVPIVSFVSFSKTKRSEADTCMCQSGRVEIQLNIVNVGGFHHLLSRTCFAVLLSSQVKYQ